MLIYNFNNFIYNIFITIIYFIIFPFANLENNNSKIINNLIFNFQKDKNDKQYVEIIYSSKKVNIIYEIIKEDY